LDAAFRDDLVEAQLAQEDVQPSFPSDPRGVGTSAGLVRFVAADAPLEVLPDLHQVEPGPRSLAANRLAALQAVGVRPGPRKLGVSREYPAEQVGGQQAADDLHGAEV